MHWLIFALALKGGNSNACFFGFVDQALFFKYLPVIRYNFHLLSHLLLLLWIICVIYVLCLSCFPVFSLLWSPEGKGLTSWLLFVMLIVILVLSDLVSWDRCGA